MFVLRLVSLANFISLARFLVLACALYGSSLSVAWGQRSSGDLLPEEKLRSLGLTSAWHTQVEFDATRGHLSGIAVYYDDTATQFLVQITHPAGRVLISERDLTPLGKPLGISGAMKKAQAWVAEWKLRHPKSKDPEPVIEEMEVPETFLAATSLRGMVQGFNGETGATQWVTKIGSELLPTLPPAVNYNQVAVINGSKLYVLNKKDGKVVWEKHTKHAPGGGPVMSSSYIFAPMVNGMMETFELEKYSRPSVQFRSFGRIFQQPIVFKDAVAWTTDQGNVYVANAEANGVRFRVSSRSVDNHKDNRVPPSSNFTPGPPGFLWFGPNRAALMYFGTSEGLVYCCEADRGQVVNRFSASEPVSQSPVVVKDRVFVISENDNLFCLDALTLQELWLVPGVRQFISGSEERIYVKDNLQNLVGLDIKTGSRLGSVPMGSIDFVHTNIQSDRIYLGTTGGVIQCIREAKRYFPWVHSGTEVKKKFDQVLNQNKPGEADAPEDEPAAEMKKPAAEDDPFGEPAKKEAKPAAAEDDPFK